MLHQFPVGKDHLHLLGVLDGEGTQEQAWGFERRGHGRKVLGTRYQVRGGKTKTKAKANTNRGILRCAFRMTT
jgi:hypothetical protein